MALIDLLLELPLAIRLTLVFLAGVLLATQLNRGIYRLAWFARPIGPWSAPHAEAPPRTWFDRLPILGWLSLRREASLHGRGFWLRPLIIELAMGVGMAWLYWYLVDQAAVVPLKPNLVDTYTLHAQFCAHFVLISLMVVATFIDFDEQTIPDAITVPGALLGLLIAALLPDSRLLVTKAMAAGFTVVPLHLASGTALPNQPDFPSRLFDREGLYLAWLMFAAWWVAILPWLWTTRRGWTKAVQYFCVTIWRRTGRLLPLLGAAGMVGIWVTWTVDGDRWESLISSLAGMAFGGGLIWAVRIAGTRALGQEAMGFGDVTLMAMIGAFTGWQPTLMIFFLAPVAAMFISVTQWLLTRRKDIAFGPYLCLATLFVMLQWDWLWEEYGRAIFSLGWYVPAMVVFCVVMIWAMLTVLQFLRGGLEYEEDDDQEATDTTGETAEPPAESDRSDDENEADARTS